MARHEPVERFDRVWEGWADLAPLEERIAQHRANRGPYLAALEAAADRAPVPRVLEIGCGSAIDLCLLVQGRPGLRAAGLDISPAGLAVARAFAHQLGVAADLCCGDVFALPFRTGSFGLVFSQGVLEHFPDPRGALREQGRVLAPGGFLAVSVPQTFTGYTLHKRAAIRRGTWPWGWEGQFTARALRRLGEREGLEVIQAFGYQYWPSWREPAWVARDLWGKAQRRNPWRGLWPFPQVERGWEGLWSRLERRWGHLFMQNVAAVFRRPAP